MELPPNIPDSLGIWVLGSYLATSCGHRTMWEWEVESVGESVGSCPMGGMGEEAFS